MWLAYPQLEIGKVFIVVISESTALQVTHLVFKVLLPREDRLSLLIAYCCRAPLERKRDRLVEMMCNSIKNMTQLCCCLAMCPLTFSEPLFSSGLILESSDMRRKKN